jgi:hypothetical protein
MKRMAALLALALGCTVLGSAQNKSKGTEMTGWICDSKCVKQDAGKAACDASCTTTGGYAVFVDDQGKVTKIANPKMAKDKKGKKVVVHGEMMKDTDTMKVYDVVLANAG